MFLMPSRHIAPSAHSGGAAKRVRRGAPLRGRARLAPARFAHLETARPSAPGLFCSLYKGERRPRISVRHCRISLRSSPLRGRKPTGPDLNHRRRRGGEKGWRGLIGPIGRAGAATGGVPLPRHPRPAAGAGAGERCGRAAAGPHPTSSKSGEGRGRPQPPAGKSRSLRSTSAAAMAGPCLHFAN